jgi:intein-encoded DNA endonuclease-like protein
MVTKKQIQKHMKAWKAAIKRGDIVIRKDNNRTFFEAITSRGKFLFITHNSYNLFNVGSMYKNSWYFR